MSETKRLYHVDQKLLEKAREKGHCLCNLVDPCPCKKFLDEGDCRCGVYRAYNCEQEGGLLLCKPAA